MKLIVGLGNPGKKYEQTRHNIGKKLLSFAADRHRIKFVSQKRLQVSVAGPFDFEGHEVMLAHPESYMNVSGVALKMLCQEYQIQTAKDLLVVVDDAAIPFGKLRLRYHGSSGGHNGLKSIEEHLQTDAYARLRMGIGVPGEALEDYVLREFTRDEKKLMEGFLSRADQACGVWISEAPDRAMNVINAG